MDAEDIAEADENGAAREALLDLLEEVAEAGDLEVEVEVSERDGVLEGRFEGDDVGPLIGRRGQTIDAIQHLAQRIVSNAVPSAGRITVDAGGYRARRREAVCALADDVAEEAVRSGVAVEMEAMPASERRVVHEYLRERGDVQTHSEGEEPERYLVVSPIDGDSR